MRVLATSIPLAMLLALAACGDTAEDTDTPPPPPPPGDDDDDTEDTDDPGPQASQIEIYVSFGTAIDNAAGTTATATLADGTELPSYVEIVFASDLWSGEYADTEEYCYVSLPVENQARASWGDAEGYWFSYDYVPTTYESDCSEWKYDVSELLGLTQYGVTVEEYYASLNWAVGLGGDVDADILTAIENAGADPQYFMGGTYKAYAVDPDTSEEFVDLESLAYTTGLQADESLVLLEEAGELVSHTSESAYQPAGMSNGYYITNSWTYWAIEL